MGTSATDALTPLLQHAKEVVDECLPDGPSGQSFDSNTLEDRLNPVLFAVLSAGRSTSCVKLSEVDRADLWHIVCKLWVSREIACSVKKLAWIARNRS